VTLGGWPLYRFAADPGPGKWKGQGVGGTWFVVAPDGKRNLSCLPPGVSAPKAANPESSNQDSGADATDPNAGGSTGGDYNY
jgi:hypothetical protein